MKILKTLLLLTIFLFFINLFALTVYCQNVELKHHKISENLYAIIGAGCNVALCVTEEGALIIDTGSSPEHGKALLIKIQELTDKPIKYIIYTHYHDDHNQGTQNFPASTKVLSHIKTRKNMEEIMLPQLENLINKTYPEYIKKLEQNVEKLKAEKSADLAEKQKELTQYKQRLEALKQIKPVLPEFTYEKNVVLHLSGKKVKLLHLGPGPTNGDTIIYFPEEKAIHTGDFFMNNWFPYFDPKGGSDSINWIKVLEKIVEMDIETVIPGHGEISDINGILAYIQCLKELRAEVEKCVNQGVPVEEAKENITLPKYKDMTYYDYSLRVAIEAIYNEIKEKEGKKLN